MVDYNIKMNLEQRALKFAVAAHEGQFRLDGRTPYVVHPIRAVENLRKIGITNKNILCSGYLHDVIEDCNIKKEDLEKEFNPNIARIVSALTRDVGREKYKERLKESDYQVQIVKLADVLDNCRDVNEYVSKKTIKRLANDCMEVYFSMAAKISPKFHVDISMALFEAQKYFSISLINPYEIPMK